jgi:plasmid stabilization system protein ParE
MKKPSGYQVFWHPAAEEQLTVIWTATLERGAIAAAADACDQALRHTPHGVGESRDETYRIGIVGPLAFMFRVSEPDRIVMVMRVWPARRTR